MKTALLDTSVISECIRLGVSASLLDQNLKDNKFSPVVCMYTIYELSRIFFTKNPDKTMLCFSFIQQLNPEFSGRRSDLYLMEADKLRNDIPVNYLFREGMKSILLDRIENFCNGKHDVSLEEFINTRQAGFTTARDTQWRPLNDGKILKKYKRDFSKMLADFMNPAAMTTERLNWVNRVISVATDEYIILTPHETKNLTENLVSYPSFRTLLFSALYLEFLTESNNATPSEDRYTDSLIMIEGSYCSSIISHDKAFIETHVKNINPHIEAIKLTDIIQLP